MTMMCYTLHHSSMFHTSTSFHRPPILSRLKTTVQKVSGARHYVASRARLLRHPFSIQNTHCASTCSHHPPIPSHLKAAVQKPSGARQYVTPKG